jgi:hypothetical protein
MIYGVKRTTVYLPDGLKTRLEAEAERRGVTEAEIIRLAVDKELLRRAPRGGFITDDPGELITENLDQFMEGFGER